MQLRTGCTRDDRTVDVGKSGKCAVCAHAVTSAAGHEMLGTSNPSVPLQLPGRSYTPRTRYLPDDAQRSTTTCSAGLMFCKLAVGGVACTATRTAAAHRGRRSAARMPQRRFAVLVDSSFSCWSGCNVLTGLWPPFIPYWVILIKLVVTARARMDAKAIRQLRHERRQRDQGVR